MALQRKNPFLTSEMIYETSRLIVLQVTAAQLLLDLSGKLTVRVVRVSAEGVEVRATMNNKCEKLPI